MLGSSPSVFPITTPSRSRVIQELFLSGPKSRADIARATSLTKVTVSEAVDDLLGKNILEELSSNRELRPGKPSIPVQLNNDSFSFLAVDLSAAKTWSYSFFGFDGQPLDVVNIDRRGLTGQAFFDSLAQKLSELISQSDTPVAGVGVGSPGVINRKGKVISAPNLGWEDFDLQNLLQTTLGVAVVVENDAHLSASAIHTFSSSGAYILLIRIAGGLGAGLVVDGVVPAGQGNAAGELGHTVVVENGRECACGKKGCLETYVSSSELEVDLNQALGIAAIKESASLLGTAISPIVGLLNLNAVVIAANEDLRSDQFLQQLSQTIAERTLPISHENLTVEYTDFAHDIVLRGAAGRVMGQLLGLGQ